MMHSILFLCLAIAAVSHALLAPQNLRVEYLNQPWGVDVASPRFSWIVDISERGGSQSAYLIYVSDGSTGSIIWNSGKVQSSATSQVAYAGSALRADTTYLWSVQYWDNHGVQSAESNSQFHTGLFQPSDWQGAVWIGGFNQVRNDFTVDGGFDSATVHVSGLGYYELFLNGEKVGPNKLDVGWTTYNKRVLYSSYDVTHLVRRGQNGIGAEIGAGWYVRDGHGPRSLLVLLSIRSGVNSTQYVTSNLNWHGTQGPIIYDDIYNGETYDSRLYQDGWNEPGFFNASKWAPVTTVPNPGGVLSAQLMPAVHIVGDFPVRAITEPQPGVYVFDFGQNFSGWCRLRVTGNAGTTVTLRHAEILMNDGSGMIYTANLRSAKATDVYILSGDQQGEEYMPKFTYHGFRYVELTGFPGVPDESTLRGIVVHSDAQQTGEVIFSRGILNQIQHNVQWGQKTNLMSVPTDCDQRDERKGWMGDASLTAEEALHNFDLAAFYTNFLRDIQDIQESGTVTDTVPLTFGSRPADPAWGVAYPVITYWMWRHYGDRRILSQHWDSLKAYIDDQIDRINKSGVSKYYSYYGDWVPPPPATRVDNSMTSAYAMLIALDQIIEIATTLGDTASKYKYTNTRGDVVAGFNSAWYDVQAGEYMKGQPGFQSANAYGLRTFAAPNVTAVADNLVADIRSHATHLTTGIVGTKALLEALSIVGRDDVALQLAENTDYPSWGYMITNTIEPATTLWELWDAPFEGPGMNSRNHIMYGSIGSWFYRSLAGINQQPTSAGFDAIVIRPGIVGDLTSVSSSIATPRGQLSVEWTGAAFTCGTSAEDEVVTMDCGAGSLITGVQFASFGTPTGSCGYFDAGACQANDTVSIVSANCVGKQSCQISVSDTTFGDPCYGTKKIFAAQLGCSTVQAASMVQVQIPQGATATIYLPLIGGVQNTLVTESGAKVWQNGQLVPGVPGVTAASVQGQDVLIDVLAGSYTFAVARS